MFTPIIKSRTGRFGNNHWVAFSPKIGRDVNLLSDLELDHWIFIETNPSVENFCEQPREVSAEVDGEVISSIPDMWVRFKDGNEAYIEVKYAKDLNDEDVKKQINVQKSWCEQNGVGHQVKTEEDLRSNPIYLENLKEIVPYVQNSATPVEIDKYKISEFLKINGRKNINDIYGSLSLSLPRIYEAVFCMIYSGNVIADIEKKHLGLETEVWINGKEELDR